MIRVLTFGCRLNTLESEILRKNAQKLGLRDVAIINSCAVTAEAERQVRQAIRKIGREHPETRVVVTGCSGEIHSESYLAMPNVVGILHNAQKLNPEALEKFCLEKEGILPSTTLSSCLALRSRTYVAIQNVGEAASTPISF
jgi:threonylcarbamoyladenosine tRNA methylthiotransferase MtaB